MFVFVFVLLRIVFPFVNKDEMVSYLCGYLIQVDTEVKFMTNKTL